MQKLIWKEWNEQSWKLAFGSVVLAALAFIGLRSRILADETMVMWVCFLGFSLLPILASTGLVPAERSDGTLEALLSLPVTPRRILTVKTAIGLLLVAGPMIAAAIVSLALAANREMDAVAMLMLYARSTLTALSLFIWMMALTIRLPSEARAAMLALGVLILLAFVASARQVNPHVPMIVAEISPLSFIMHEAAADAQIAPPPLVAIVGVQLGIAAALWTWASRSLANSAN
jgi:ABC-type Na+ efflux pump permease subunit